MQQHPDNNDILPPALEKVSQELKRASSDRSDVLAADLKARQRAMLVEHAERTIMPTAKKVEAPKAASPKPRAPLFAWGGFALAGALAVLALFVTTKNLPQGGNALRALRIPAAHAQDAFALVAESKDNQGVNTDSAFKIETKIAVGQQDLHDALRIVPAIQYDLQKTGDNEYRIVPKEDLAEGSVYKVSIATIVDESTPKAREFSWAMQTKETFKLVSSIPATGSGNVPVNAGIEFKFTQSGFEAPTGSQFTIAPAVKGHFEIRGRTLAFVPDESLSLGTLYEVKLDKSFAPAGTTDGLPADVKIRFETDANKPGEYQPELRVNVPDTMYAPTGKPVTVNVNYGTEGFNAVKVTGYAVTTDVARQVMEQRLRMPEYAIYTRGKTDVYDAAQKTKAFDLDVNVTRVDGNTPTLVLPVADKGMYLVRFEPKDVKNAKVSWSLVQVTDTAAYSFVDRDGIYVWAVNAGTSRALSNLAIQKDDERIMTDASGVARIATPSSFSATNTTMGDNMPFVVLTVGEGKDAALLAVQPSYYTYLNFVRPGYQSVNHNRTMAFVRAERALYRTNDEMTVFGLARDRDAKAGLNDVTVRITKGGQLFDLRTGDLKVYVSTNATPDATGRFTADLKWSDLAPGYYSVEVTRDGGEVVASQGFEVREYIKPSYSIEVRPEQDSYFMGDTVKAPVQVKFFDGTPMAKATFNVDVDSASMTYHGQITTDENGNAMVQIPSSYVPCAPLAATMNQYCSMVDSPYVYIRPTVGEEAEQETSFSVAVYRSRIGAELNVAVSGTAASGTVTTWAQDLEAQDLGRSKRVSQSVAMTAYPKYWVKKQTGTYYNSITKLNEPIYTYEEKSDEPIKQELKTDAQGLAHFSFEMRDDRQYSVYVETTDAQNHMVRAEGYVSRQYSNAYLTKTAWIIRIEFLSAETPAPRWRHQARCRL
ncbi:MAG: Ig-like domain-containing protein [Patescibacteria group bacterium]